MRTIIGQNLSLSLRPTPTAPAQARAAVSQWLAPQRRDEHLMDVALLLVSELVTNTVRHALLEPDASLRLDAWLEQASVHLEVWDGGTEGTVARRERDRDDEVGGFGLDLVARLSQDWGIERDGRGTRVWLELGTPVQAG
jgi:anti-sigma regulatory factor (Ser/Thr protein kinase)